MQYSEKHKISCSALSTIAGDPLEMAGPLVAFDESGNTGQDLLNPAQPVFVLASVHLSELETDDLFMRFSLKAGQELKFTNLIRRPSGQQKAVSFPQADVIRPDKMKAYLIHKRFLVTTKVVDLLVEPVFHYGGIDLYERGGNLATANFLHFSMPAIFGETIFDRFQKSFVQMIRRRDTQSIRQFYRLCGLLFNSCQNPDYQAFLAPILASEDLVHEILQNVGVTALDPAVPAFFCHCDAWGRYFGQEFDLVHDASKPIAHERELIDLLASKDEIEIEVGYDRRKNIFPLKVRAIKFESSKLVRQLQVADVLAGAMAYLARRRAGLSIDQALWGKMAATRLPELIIGGIWPDTAVTPEELGTDELGGIDALEYMAELLARQRKRRSSV